MNWIWLLVAMPLAALLYFAWVVGQEKPTGYVAPLAPANPPVVKKQGALSPERSHE